MDTFNQQLASEASSSYDIVVVGGGLAGLAFVRALRDTGIHIAIIDELADFDERKLNFGNDLQPNALLALEFLGLLEEVKNLGAVHHHYFAEKLGGRPLARWDYSTLNHSHPYAVCVRPHLMRRLLRDAVVGIDSVDVIIPAQFGGYEAGESHHTVLVKTQGGQRMIKTRLLVGSDGPYSRVRAAAGIPSTMRRYSHGWVDTILAQDTSGISEGHVVFGRGEYLGLVPTRAGELVTFHLTPLPSQAEYQARIGSIEDFRRLYLRMAPILENCIGNFRSWDQAVYTSNLRVRAGRWVDNRIALVGDAALSVNAITSQGACLALEGGVRLASVVKRCFACGDLSARSLAPYEAWSRPEAEAIQELGDLSLRVFSSANPVVSAIKERMLLRANSNPRLRHHILAYSCGLHWMTPHGLNWLDGLAGAGLWPRKPDGEGESDAL